MDLISKSYNVHTPEALPPNPSLTSSIFQPRTHSSSDTSFPIIAIAVIGILATAFLLVGYYIFVIKCCLNWHRIDILRRFSLSRRRNEDPLMTYASPVEARGLDESVIRSIPVLKFKKTGDLNSDLEGRDLSECAVCLNEFQEDEKLRVIPNCSHVFHIDCIDVWLQNNSNCPLCRTSISSNSFPANKTRPPFSTPLDPNSYTENLIGGNDDDFVVIELGNHNLTDQIVPTVGISQERFNSPTTISSPKKLEQRIVNKKGRTLLHKVTSMGDECINTRGQDDQFLIQPIRRSFSMDSSGDRQLYLAVQEAVRKKSLVDEVISPIEDCSSSSSSSSRVRRSFFSFGSGRGSRNAVSPLSLEP